MQLKQIHYVEIEKFKSFDEKIRIELGHPAVLIGPNNAGKTSVIQALALWSRGIRAWYDKKGQPQQKTKRERISAGINRLNLFELPVTDTRQLWKDTQLSHSAKLAGNFKRHFHTLRRYVGEFKGIAIFDSDGNPKVDSTEENLTVCHWKSYELENHFITPEVLKLYVEDVFGEDGQELFRASNLSQFIDSLNETLLSEVFGGDESQLQEFESSSKALQRTLLKNTKMSSFTTKVFKSFAAKQKQPVLINKGEFYQFVQFIDIDDIPAEVTEKLDLIAAILKL